MAKIDEELLDRIAALEVQAILEGLEDEELRKSPAFLEKVRKFMSQNRLNTTGETPGVTKVVQHAQSIPVFEN